MRSTDMPDKLELFGNVATPFAEPAWYSSLNSPYWSHPKYLKLRSICRQHLEQEIVPFAGDWEEAGEAPLEVFKRHAKNGWTAASIFPTVQKKWLGDLTLPGGIEPEEWDIWCDFICVDEGSRSGYLGVSWGLGGGNAIGAPPLVVAGNDEQKRRLLVPILRGEKRICLGITEPSGGSDVAGIQTTAVKSPDGKGWIVNGSKKWITNALYADHMTTAVRTGPKGSGAAGISVLVVPLKVEGVTLRKIKNTGVNASGSTYVELENVFVPAENLLGEVNQGFMIIMANFLHERIVLCVQANRMARVCLEDAYEYAVSRKTFGKRLIDQPIIRAKISDMGRIIEANHAWLEQICYHMTTVPKKQADRDLAGLAALLKVSCTRGLEFCNREALQIFGGVGYQRGGRGHRVEQISRDLRVMCVGGGSDEIMGDLGLRMAELLAKSKAKTGSGSEPRPSRL